MLGRGGRLVAVGAWLFVGSLVWSHCSKPGAPSSSARPDAAPLIGPLTPVVSVRELMRDMIDPIADNIFDAVWWEDTKQGSIAHAPKTDEDWEKIRIGAVTIAEGIYLLKIPRPFTPPGDVNNSVGPNAPELSPTAIKAKLNKDPVLWEAKIEALRNVAKATLEAVNRKNVDAVFQAAADLDVACENCHLEYWYPGDRPTVERERKVRATFGNKK
jgi:hypothetical protein